MVEIIENDRLSVSFHQTFIPERLYITAFLRYVAGGGGGTDQQISEQTGIPVGKSSGKVPAIIRYCSGMGLITVSGTIKVEEREFDLTPFGRCVLLEDPNFSEALTQWLVHFHLCRSSGGAEIWFQCFAKGHSVLGMDFSEDELNTHLANIFGKKKRSLIGPLIRAYEETASLKVAGVLHRQSGRIIRTPAPLLSGFRNGYSGFLLSLWDQHFPGEYQITANDFEQRTYLQQIAGWDLRQYEIALEMLEAAGAVRIDKQMRPWVLSRSSETNKFWPALFDELA